MVSSFPSIVTPAGMCAGASAGVRVKRPSALAPASRQPLRIIPGRASQAPMSVGAWRLWFPSEHLIRAWVSARGAAGGWRGEDAFDRMVWAREEGWGSALGKAREGDSHMTTSKPSPEPNAGFVTIDHTADVALRVWAPSVERLFVEAARGLLSLLTDPETVTAREGRRLEVSGLDLEELLVAWLNEILYRFESEGLLLAEVTSAELSAGEDDHRFGARCRGERYDPQRHPPGVGVKAATYHNLRIAPDRLGHYDVTLVLDT
ncbi:MAG: hypothetical protein GF330_07055 [Candidatus Eisenbacteria bacterium]|nr:hypothetical protein [Candidatus Eisenbacteria bacterium]